MVVRFQVLPMLWIAAVGCSELPYVPNERVITNPGIGIATFGALNGDLPIEQHPESSVAYYRFYWSDYELEDQQFQDSPLEDLLTSAASRGQTVGLRLMPYGPDPGGYKDVPDWMYANVKRHAFEVDGGLGFIPDHDSPVYVRQMNEAISHLASFLNGDPRVEFVDIGSVGLHGEWHVSAGLEAGASLPLAVAQDALIGHFFEVFDETEKVMLVGDTDDGGVPLMKALQQGAGWRADCLGDRFWKAPRWNHMDDFYPRRIESEAQAQDNWKLHPVIFETCGDPSDWSSVSVDEFQTTLDYALAYHASLVNFRSKPIPTRLRPALDQFLTKVGYQFSFEVVQFKVAGNLMNVETLWSNDGVAPPYREFTLNYRLRSRSGEVLKEWTSAASFKGALPGKRTIREQLELPSAAGTYFFELSLQTQAAVPRPLIELHMDGKLNDGWYPVSEVDLPGDGDRASATR